MRLFLSVITPVINTCTETTKRNTNSHTDYRAVRRVWEWIRPGPSGSAAPCRRRGWAGGVRWCSGAPRARREAAEPASPQRTFQPADNGQNQGNKNAHITGGLYRLYWGRDNVVYLIFLVLAPFEEHHFPESHPGFSSLTDWEKESGYQLRWCTMLLI